MIIRSEYPQSNIDNNNIVKTIEQLKIIAK